MALDLDPTSQVKKALETIFSSFTKEMTGKAETLQKNHAITEKIEKATSFLSKNSDTAVLNDLQAAFSQENILTIVVSVLRDGEFDLEADLKKRLDEVCDKYGIGSEGEELTELLLDIFFECVSSADPQRASRLFYHRLKKNQSDGFESIQNEVKDSRNRLSQQIGNATQEISKKLDELRQMKDDIVPEQSGNDRKADSAPHDSNSQYVAPFTEPLFLDSGNSRVTLQNLFLWQDYMDERKGKQTNLKEYIEEFITDTDQKLLIIEGDAGTGKSTLVSCLNYMYANPGAKVDGKEHFDFGGRTLVTVRLRDFESEREIVSKEQSLITAVGQYLNRSVRELKASYGQNLYILDGYDELCTSDSGISTHKVIQDLMDKLPFASGKMILTTRPSFISVEKKDGMKIDGMKKIILEKYSPEKRNDWFKKYVSVCNKKIPDYIHDYIANLGDEKTIFDVPLNLYMLAGKPPKKEKLENTWSLYQDILYRDIRDTIASSMTGDPDKNENINHPDAEHWEIYYRICEEIAYSMYKCRNEKLYVDTDDIREILNGMKSDPDMNETYLEGLKENCHALCGFWRHDPGRGIYEFYHNNIRDFFLCEKIYRLLNQRYPKEAHKEDMKGDRRWIDLAEGTAKELADAFQFGRIERKVLEFLSMRTAWKLNDGKANDFSLIEAEKDLEDKFYPLVSQIMVTDDSIYPHDKKRSLYAVMAATVKSLWEVLACINKPLLKEGEYTPLWKDVEEVNQIGILKYLFMEKEDGLIFSGADLSGADLQMAYLKNASLISSNMERINLRGSNLNGADLTDARLKDTAFTGASLIGTTPSANELFDDPEKEIPWTEFKGYYPEKYLPVDEEIRHGLKKLDEDIYPGDSVLYGYYPQESSDRNKKQRIKWRVLEVRGNRALLLSEKILDQYEYKKQYVDTNWKESDIRKWLNNKMPGTREELGGFYYEAFLDSRYREEDRRICRTLVEPHENINTKYQNDQGEATIDHIFLLSGEEVVKYFGENLEKEDDGRWYSIGGEQAVAVTTEYAHSRGLESNGSPDWWWLRSVGASPRDAMRVYDDGTVDADGRYVHYDEVGARPALWITLKS